MATATINVRIDGALKRAGDATLAEEGISVSEVVRALWSKLAERGKVVDELKHLLFDQENATDVYDAANPVTRGWALVDEFALAVGYDAAQEPTREQEWDDLYRQAMDEHYAEKGLFV